uniref:Uncharacterized protein n=1 Tax=Siphoviridae sp. cteoh1 TaxID=2826407 RepID=A0A8S5QKI1_9CAUD|nr:MAG TPA: hypothetical protein [Siphoviridae sp. cteoh1]
MHLLNLSIKQVIRHSTLLMIYHIFVRLKYRPHLQRQKAAVPMNCAFFQNRLVHFEQIILLGCEQAYYFLRLLDH